MDGLLKSTPELLQAEPAQPLTLLSLDEGLLVRILLEACLTANEAAWLLLVCKVFCAVLQGDKRFWKHVEIINPKGGIDKVLNSVHANAGGRFALNTVSCMKFVQGVTLW
eukprot:jgi/Chlat1/5970/Chrsp4S06182